MSDWYSIRNVDALDSPALVIYPERVKHNLTTVKTFVRDVDALRPHVKTNKCPQVVGMMLDGGITKFKCATIAEAELLATAGAKDVLLAYQPVGPKARRFCELQQKFADTTFSCLIDHITTVQELSALARTSGVKIRVFIDLNVGMNRTGVLPGEGALGVFNAATTAEGIDFIGLHVYDGHIRDSDLAMRKQKCDVAFRPVENFRDEIVRRTGKPPVVVAGGTPTFPIHAKRPGVEASPGTFIFWDRGYQQMLAEQPFEFAALVVTRVISTPDEHTVCLDLGHKSIASENPLANRIYLLNGEGLEPVGHSEEHMVFRTVEKHGLRPGHVFYGVPHHICPTVALYDEASVCQDGFVQETWPIIARKRKLTI